jgi:hypothetical protein
VCAEHQPQRVEEAAALDKFHTLLLAGVLRLIFDTAALRLKIHSAFARSRKTMIEGLPMGV